MFCSVPSWTMTLFSMYLPESPRFLMASGRRESAMAVLQRIAEENDVPPPTGVLTDAPQGGHDSLRDVFGPTLRRSSLLIYASMCGLTFVYYGISFESEWFLSRSVGLHE